MNLNGIYSEMFMQKFTEDGIAKSRKIDELMKQKDRRAHEAER